MVALLGLKFLFLPAGTKRRLPHLNLGNQDMTTPMKSKNSSTTMLCERYRSFSPRLTGCTTWLLKLAQDNPLALMAKIIPPVLLQGPHLPPGG